MFEEWTIRLSGVFLILFTLRETFRDLFQPSGSGSLSAYLGRFIFSVSKHFRTLLPSAGALAVLLTIVCWTVMVASGFAMIYWPSVPDGFNLSGAEDAGAVSRFGTALYFSFEALSTLGPGDLTPKLGWLRMLEIMEAILGFSLLTASISWIVLIYPALGRMRTLARFATNLRRAEDKTNTDIFSGSADRMVGSLAQDVIRTRVDFIHFPLIYYFYAVTERAALPEALSHLLSLASHGCSEDRPEEVRLAAATLQNALEDFAEVLAERFVEADAHDPEAVFEAFKQDHLTAQLKKRERISS